METKKFAERVKKLRHDNNMTQFDLAKQVELTPTGICYWESGKALPSLQTVQKLANIFNVSTDYLIGNDNCTTSEYDMLIRKIEKVDYYKRELLMDVLNTVVDSFINDKKNN